MTSDDIGNEIPFSNLHNHQFQDLIQRSNLQLNDNDIRKLKQLIYNPFSNNDRGKSFLSMDMHLDPDISNVAITR